MGMLSVSSTIGSKSDIQANSTSGGSGRVKQAKLKEERRNAAAIKRQRQAAASGATSGMSSSLAFTPVQGIELAAPAAKAPKLDPSERYFAAGAGFLNI